MNPPGTGRYINAVARTVAAAAAGALLIAPATAQDRDWREIAMLIHRTEHTVRYHLKQAFAKTGVRRQAELVRLVLAAGAA